MNGLYLVPAILLAVAAVTDLAFIASDNDRLRVFSKPALLPLIIFLYLTLAVDDRWFILGGLVAGWVGDILLLNRRSANFIAGLSSFLIGHIFYSVALLQGVGPVAMSVPVLSLILGMAILVWVVLRVIWPAQREFQVPLLLYAAGLAALGLSAGLRLIFIGDTGSILIASGAALFIISDTMLGYSFFKKPFGGDQLAIMTSYLLAQVGIVLGIALF
jgi:uncharacterized membrane protein YhhN